MNTRKKLSDILTNSERDSIIRVWEQSATAAEYGPLPAGEYKARVIAAECFTSKGKGTPGVKLTLTVVEPVEHAECKLWHDLWLTAAAMPSTKRDLAKIGITDLEQLDRPFPQRLVVAVRVVVRTDDDKSERNRITRFEFDHIEPSEQNPFPPLSDGDELADGGPPF
jgi:hypothetical protein